MMEETLTCIMDIGEQMLISGAEVHRVEESVRRMGCALGAERELFLAKGISTLKLAAALALGIITAKTLTKVFYKYCTRSRCRATVKIKH